MSQPRAKIDVTRRARKRPVPTRNNEILTSEHRRRRGSSVVTFSNVPRERWEACFGKWTPEKFRKAKAEQEAARAQAAAEAEARERSAAVFGENKGAGRRMFKPGTFDWGLGSEIKGRTHRRELMKSMGLRERA